LKNKTEATTLVQFDQHGVFELDAAIAAEVGGGLPKVPKPFPLLNDLLSDDNGNRMCLSPNLVCGQNTVC
jgi:hypothetical protein